MMGFLVNLSGAPVPLQNEDKAGIARLRIQLA